MILSQQREGLRGELRRRRDPRAGGPRLVVHGGAAGGRGVSLLGDDVGRVPVDVGRG